MLTNGKLSNKRGFLLTYKLKEKKTKNGKLSLSTEIDIPESRIQ